MATSELVSSGSDAQTRHADDLPQHAAPFDRITACVDGSRVGEEVLRQASRLAKVFGVRLTVLHVLEPGRVDGTPEDPLDWRLHHRSAAAYLDRLVAQVAAGAAVPVEPELLRGRAAEQICHRLSASRTSLTVIGRYGERGPSAWWLSSTARKVIETVPGSVMLVPEVADPDGEDGVYRRLMVPLDGSSLAESAMSVGARVAGAHGAELLMVHVVPRAGVVRVGAPSEEDRELERRVTERNQAAARRYLDRLRARFLAGGIRTRAVLLGAGDPRTRLMDLIGREAVDLVVCSAHGHSRPPGTSCGSVAEYLLRHVRVPMLVLREQERLPPPTAESFPGSTRGPGQTA
jgi:nucleotide-binding universal stress UspA family protein